MDERVFISHNSEWESIGNFADLIRELGFYPVVVEKEPDLGLDPNEKSKHYLYSSNIVVFVITKDTFDSQGRPHPKSNVALEIGLSEEKFDPDHKIFLVEEGAKPPSMMTRTYIPIRATNPYEGIAHLIRNIKKALPPVKDKNREKKEGFELDELERFIVTELSRETHGWLARPVVLKTIVQRFSIDEGSFNIVRHKLKRKGVITEGRIEIGHDHHGDVYLMLTRLGWDIVSGI